MKTSLLNKAEGAEQEVELRQSFAAAHLLREKLIEVLLDKAALSQKLSISKDCYELAGWPYLQADTVGYQRALQEVVGLLVDESK